MIVGSEDELERMQADGRISPEDADAVRRFGAFLTDCGPHHTSPDFDSKRFGEAYRKHYPEDYARAVAEHHAQPTAEETR